MNLGDQVGQYRITQLLGEGGMGAVYKAVDVMIEREVAIKVLRPEIGRNAALLQRFRAEAVTLARLNHAGIATLYSFQQQGDEFLMIMEYVPGKTLEQVEQERGALPVEIAVPLFLRILEAIAPAHESGILHRDIKPANIMLTTWGAIKVMDFGIARIAGAARQTRQGALVGTMEYIAPERVKGSEGDIRSDVYALGIVLYEMISGRLPFNSSNEFELMKMQLEAQPPSLSSLGCVVPAAIEEAVQRSLAKDPERRFASCEAFTEALREAAGDLRITRGDMIALVGQPAVRELGTAGHHSSVSGETLGLMQPPSSAGVSADQAMRQRVPSSDGNASAVQTISPVRAYKGPLLAVAALLLAIGLGVGAGKLAHHGDAAPPEAQPEIASPVPSGVETTPPESKATPLLPVQSTPTSQTIPAVSTGEFPVTETPVKPERPISRPRHPQSSLHDRSLKALDE